VDQFLPEQINVLSQVLNDPAIVAGAVAGVSSAHVRRFIDLAIRFVKTNHAHIVGRHFVFSLAIDRSGGVILTHREVLNATAAGTPIVAVNQTLQLVGFDRGDTRVTDAEQRTAGAPRIELVVHGTYIYCVAGGKVVFEQDAVQPEKQPPVGIAFYKPIGDFDGLLKDHFEQDLSREKSFRFWKSKPDRILLATPEKTEKLFQRALYNWLDRYVADKLRVVAETREFGQDPTDVLVITARGDHVVEVKWLGENENGTRYDEKRITEGLRQVHEYITNDPKIVQAHVVLYDARSEEKHRNNSAFDTGCKHAFCSDPKLVFLPSETVSQRATVDASLTPSPRKPKRAKPSKKRTSRKK